MRGPQREADKLGTTPGPKVSRDTRSYRYSLYSALNTRRLQLPLLQASLERLTGGVHRCCNSPQTLILSGCTYKRTTGCTGPSAGRSSPIVICYRSSADDLPVPPKTTRRDVYRVSISATIRSTTSSATVSPFKQLCLLH